MSSRILIIDDDKEFLKDITFLLKTGFECATAETGGKGLQKIHAFNPDVVLLDLMLGDENGLDILQFIHRYDETIPVIMVTDYGSIDTAVEAMRLGAFDYVSKSPKISELSILIEKAIQKRNEVFRTKSLKEEVNRQYTKMVGHSPAMESVLEKITLYADHKNSVIITGESGVGKELVARQIHTKGPYSEEPFVAINCAAIPKDLVESELFGHEKGAFTGAEKRKIGKFEMAGNGVIFLDEISELSQDIQVKLLRVLQEHEFQRVGGNIIIRSNVKIISATNKDLWKFVEEGFFREDLYYRLDVLPIHVPPLRERREDIPELVSYFISVTCKEMKIPVKKCSADAMKALQQFDWPGNIRQLKNFVTRAVILSKGNIISLEDLDTSIIKKHSGAIRISEDLIPETWEELNEMRKKAVDQVSREIEEKFVNYLMNKFDHNVSKAAEHIGINRVNLHKMINRVEENRGD